MSWQIVKNPDTEMYQIFSSVVDAFLLGEEYDVEVLRQFWQSSNTDMKRFDEIITMLDKGLKPYGNLTVTFKEAKMWDVHQAEHGPKNRQPDTCIICKEILQDKLMQEEERQQLMDEHMVKTSSAKRL